MKFGVREICEVVFRARSKMQVGNKTFYKDEPVIYFDSLKTSTLEGAGNTVYAQGGRGNARLIAWDGDRTVTFTMEDALISAEGLQILTGAGVVAASADKPVFQHATNRVQGKTASGATTFTMIVADTNDAPDTSNTYQAYAFFLDGNGGIFTEPYLVTITGSAGTYTIAAKTGGDYNAYDWADDLALSKAANGGEPVILVDYYIKRQSGATQMSITANSFGGNFYIEASTLFRNTDGKDLPAEFVIPNGKIQSNFTFTMAATGDPSTFTFTVDAFPDYPKYDKTQKVYADIQVIEDLTSTTEEVRTATAHDATESDTVNG